MATVSVVLLKSAAPIQALVNCATFGSGTFPSLSMIVYVAGIPL
ncbi:MAG: hypothetical protein AB8B72_10345 [Crocinitomicaceae bacterium]